MSIRFLEFIFWCFLSVRYSFFTILRELSLLKKKEKKEVHRNEIVFEVMPVK